MITAGQAWLRTNKETREDVQLVERTIEEATSLGLSRCRVVVQLKNSVLIRRELDRCGYAVTAAPCLRFGVAPDGRPAFDELTISWKDGGFSL